MSDGAASVRVFADGDKWCALIGDDLQSGISGFGKSPGDAMVELVGEVYARFPRAQTTPELRPMPPVEVKNRDGRVQQLYFAKDTEPYCLHHGLYEFKDGLFSWVEPTESDMQQDELVTAMEQELGEQHRRIADLERYNRLTLATGTEVKALKGQVRELQQRSDATNDLLEQLTEKFSKTLDVLTDVSHQVRVLRGLVGGLDIRTDQLKGQVNQIEGSKRWVELGDLQRTVDRDKAEFAWKLSDLGKRFQEFEDNLDSCKSFVNDSLQDKRGTTSILQDLRDRLEALEKRSATPWTSPYSIEAAIQAARTGNIPVTEPVTFEVINSVWTNDAQQD